MAADLTQALRGAAAPAPVTPLTRLPSLLVVGGGGTLGSAVLAEALVAGRFQRVTAVVDGALASAVRHLDTVALARIDEPLRGQPSLDMACVVYERERHANGRDEAFHRPDPNALPVLAQRLHDAGVRRLVVVVPHAPAFLPHALKAGFASADEAAVASIGFEHLVFVRAAQDRRADASGSTLQRFATWWLSQLRWMVPQREQPLRAVALATCVVQLARRLPHAPPGSRVLPPETLWEAAQAPSPDLALDAWLAAIGPR